MFDLCLNRIDYSITFRQLLLEIESPRYKTRASVREVWYVLSAGSTRLELATSGLTEQSGLCRQMGGQIRYLNGS